ncbi:MAG: PD-(D/E)XK nuclease-like domain-containing protein [Clostridiales bacterium]|nr:PD-(D/E)XK nuclease-like domain-containing protein [Clostridiales bacterium]
MTPNSKPKPRPPFLREPEDVYHARSKSGEFLSSHLLREFRKSPQLYRARILGEISDVMRPAYLLGRAIHCYLLEKHAFFDRYTIGGPINPATRRPYGRATTAWAKWEAAQNERREVISDDDFEIVRSCGLAVEGSAAASELLSCGEAELVCRATLEGVPCQVRCDYVNDTSIVDLKTTDDIDGFETAITKYGYAHQLAFYRDVVAAHPEGRVMDAYLCAVEKKAPWRCGWWYMPSDILDAASAENRVVIEMLRVCRESDTWASGYEQMRVYGGGEL